MKEKIKSYLDELEIIRDGLKQAMIGYNKKTNYEKKKTYLKNKYSDEKVKFTPDKFNFILRIPSFEEQIASTKSLIAKKRSGTIFRRNRYYRVVLNDEERSDNTNPVSITFEDAFDIISQIKEKYTKRLGLSNDPVSYEKMKKEWDDVLEPYHKAHWDKIIKKNKRKDEKKKFKKEKIFLYKNENNEPPTSTSLLELTHLEVKLNNLNYELFRKKCSGLRKIEIYEEKEKIRKKADSIRKAIKNLKNAI